MGIARLNWQIFCQKQPNYVIQGINSGGFLGSELYLVYLYVFFIYTLGFATRGLAANLDLNSGFLALPILK